MAGEPITEKQVQFILRLDPSLEEFRVRRLGKWEASDLIERLLADETGETATVPAAMERKRETMTMSRVMLIVVAIALGAVLLTVALLRGLGL